MNDPQHAVCLLGANLGDRAATLRRAVFALASAPEIEIDAASRLWETPPWGETDQPSFLNAAVALRTTLDPPALLDRCLRTEEQLGRRREASRRWGPRLIDIDVALYGETVHESESLRVPHARLHERAFALAPLLEVAPDARDPRTGAFWRDAFGALSESTRNECVPGAPLLLDGEAARRAAARTTEAGDAEADASLLARSVSQEETEALGAAFGEALRGGETVALSGALGAGKTCFVRGVARGLGVGERVTSPSYVLVKSYEGTRLTLHHADFYRLAEGAAGAEDELATLGLEDDLEDMDAVVLIEWADQFPGWLEPPFIHVGLTGAGDEPRLVCIRRVLPGKARPCAS